MTARTGDIGGDIRVLLTVSGGRVEHADIRSTRPKNAARVFNGKSPAGLTREIGAVFSLCGRAQTIAALRAAEAALGIPSDPSVEAARNALRHAEMISQSAMRLCLFWPRALGLAPEPGLVRLALETERAMITGLFGGAGWTRPGAATIEPAPALDEVIERLAEAVDEFCGGTPLRQELARLGLEGFGALPEGMDPEEGAFARQWDDERTAEARAAYGPGLAARLEASLTDLLALPGWLLAGVSAVSASEERAPARNSGMGMSEVETARGRLVHRVSVTDGLVSSCELSAPTEANFRPGGPVTAGLIGADAKDRARLELAAQLHVLAIDPCVA
jgi:hypothetical protein